MLLFLIRHGETVDNVAGLYAGSRDSALTVHGVLQASRLGDHLQLTRPPLTHIFASPLQRALKTADALRTAQTAVAAKLADGRHGLSLDICRVQDLAEQDFGFYEGKPFYARSQGASKSGKETHRDAHSHEPDFVDVESKTSLDERATRFIIDHIYPLLEVESSTTPLCVAVVSHGILLSHLWRCFLHLLPPRSVAIAPEVLAQRGEMTLERLGGFSNTGFLELKLQRQEDTTTRPPASTREAAAPEPLQQQRKETAVEAVPLSSTTPAPGSDPETSTVALKPSAPLDDFKAEILVVNGQTHLQGVKRARGGIGRMRHDEGQKTLDSFFKRPKKS